MADSLLALPRPKAATVCGSRIQRRRKLPDPLQQPVAQLVYTSSLWSSKVTDTVARLPAG